MPLSFGCSVASSVACLLVCVFVVCFARRSGPRSPPRSLDRGRRPCGLRPRPLRRRRAAPRIKQHPSVPRCRRRRRRPSGLRRCRSCLCVAFDVRQVVGCDLQASSFGLWTTSYIAAAVATSFVEQVVFCVLHVTQFLLSFGVVILSSIAVASAAFTVGQAVTDIRQVVARQWYELSVGIADCVGHRSGLCRFYC